MDDSATGIAFQTGLGVVVDITDKIGLEAGYRYFDVSGVDLEAVDGSESDINFTQHQALFGLRYSF